MHLSKRFSSIHAGHALLVIATLFLAVTSASAGPLAVVPSGTIVGGGVPYALATAWDFMLTQSYQVTALDLYNDGTPFANVDPVACGRQVPRLDTPSEPCWRPIPLVPRRRAQQMACSTHFPSLPLSSRRALMR